VRAAFASARTLEPTDAEVARVLARVPTGGRRDPRGRGAVALALAGVLFAVAGAGAATGVLPIGTELSPLNLVPGAGGHATRQTESWWARAACPLPVAGS
jgi:hypothetical protein